MLEKSFEFIHEKLNKGRKLVELTQLPSQRLKWNKENFRIKGNRIKRHK